MTIHICGQHTPDGEPCDHLKPEAYGSQPRRSVICSCGWGTITSTLREAERLATEHRENGCEGSDHVTHIIDGPTDTHV